MVARRQGKLSVMQLHLLQVPAPAAEGAKDWKSVAKEKIASLNQVTTQPSQKLGKTEWQSSSAVGNEVGTSVVHVLHTRASAYAGVGLHCLGVVGPLPCAAVCRPGYSKQSWAS
jgi:hypothetical protein